MPPETPDSRRRARIGALDVVRGFALCGILLANVQPIAHVGDALVAVQNTVQTPGTKWMGLLVEQRFFPIFSLLFGIGFSLLLESAAGRTSSPRLLLLRRLLVLLAIGLVHMFALWRGDILTIYAVVGLVVCGLLVLLRTPLRPVLQALFAPLGRMALTNYLSATVLVLAISRFVAGPPETWPVTTVLLIAGAILAGQWLVSTVWLRRFRYGPMEWLWRWATWLRRPAMQRIGDGARS
ncbi:DUF418 domain-containing protein [Nonomuraea sp. NPDC050451]|uniref:DUF418 domain-containing protein n=1 Tax=Nonomuraea sp. NPDC050451 TaxID=3364364 RepID=UPI0037BCA386